MNLKMKNLSRKLSYLLRHDPENLEMDGQGWVLVEELLKKLHISMAVLEETVATNDKKRFGFDESKKRIRANQGHSKDLNVDIKFEEVKFPKTYYHGTPAYNMKSILSMGLKSQKRAYVHLSKDVETATKVALRRGQLYMILEIDGSQMKFDGYKIYESDNGVILTEEVPPKYIKIKK
jgi:putative RNA 2'-phosphotransferase